MENEEKKLILPPPPPPKPEPKQIVVHKTHYLDNSVPVPPPQAVDLEQVILGAILIDTNAMLQVSEIMSPEVFHRDAHRIIYRAMEQLLDRSEGIDLLTVSEELRKAGKLDEVGGAYYLVEITQKVSSSAHIEHHCRIVLQKYMLREMITTSRKVMFDSLHRDPDVFDIMDYVEGIMERIKSVAVHNARRGGKLTAKEELRQKVERVRSGETPGLYIGIDEFDQWSGGWQPRELVTIAARPGMGKTAVCISIISRLSVDKNIPTAFFSLEMSDTDVKNRLVARVTGLDYSKIRKGLLDDTELEKVEAALDFIESSCMEILDSDSHKNVLERIVTDIRKLKREKDVKIVFIDYVQLIRLSRTKGSVTDDLNEITGALKALANELDIPIVMLAQLNREVDKRPGKRPVLADLKQSGSIEQDSDMVVFLLREAYYQEKSSPVPIPPNIAGKLEWIVAKGRNTGIRDFLTFIDFTKYTLGTSLEIGK